MAPASQLSNSDAEFSEEEPEGSRPLAEENQQDQGEPNMGETLASRAC